MGVYVEGGGIDFEFADAGGAVIALDVDVVDFSSGEGGDLEGEEVGGDVGGLGFGIFE